MNDPTCASATVRGPAFSGEVAAIAPAPATALSAREQRLRATVEENYDFVWRTMRHLGCTDIAAQDGAQQVMCVLARHFDRVAAGAERSFLYSIAVRVASTFRRTARRRPEAGADALDDLPSDGPRPDELVEERRKHAVLQALLDEMPFDLRVIFVLHEIEELSSPEVAAALDLPLGTVASRLRRARERFHRLTLRRQVQERQGR